MLLEKETTCIRSNFLLERDVLLALTIAAASLIQVAWSLFDARTPKSTTERSKQACSPLYFILHTSKPLIRVSISRIE